MCFEICSSQILVVPVWGIDAMLKIPIHHSRVTCFPFSLCLCFQRPNICNCCIMMELLGHLTRDREPAELILGPVRNGGSILPDL